MKVISVRIVAQTLDLLIIAVFLGIVSLTLFYGSWWALGSWFSEEWFDNVIVRYSKLSIPIAMFSLAFLYIWLTEASAMQATFGKHILKLTIEAKNGGRMSVKQSFLRNLYKLLPMPIAMGIAVLEYRTTDILTEIINVNIVYYTTIAMPLIVFVISSRLKNIALHDALAGCRVLPSNLPTPANTVEKNNSSDENRDQFANFSSQG